MPINLKAVTVTPLQTGDRAVIVRDGTSMQLVDPGTLATKDIPAANVTALSTDAVLVVRGTGIERIAYVTPEPKVEQITVASAARDLALADDRKALRFTHATPVLTIRAQADLAYAAGFRADGSMQFGGNIVASAGVTLNGDVAGTFPVGTEADGIIFELRKISDNVWLASSGGGAGGGGSMSGDDIAAALVADLSDTEKRAQTVALKGLAVGGSSPAQATGALPVATATAGEVNWTTPVSFAPATGAEVLAKASNTAIITPGSLGTAFTPHAGTVASGAMDINLTTDGFVNWTGSISANTDIQFDAMPSTWAGNTVTVLLTNTTANARTLTVSDTAAVTVTVGNDVPSLVTPAQINATSLLVFYVASATQMILTTVVHSPAP